MATVIKMFYVLRDKATGKVLEDNSSNEVGFIVGRGQVLEKLEEKVVGLNEGEKAQFTLLCEDALGPRSEEAFQVVPKEQFAGIDLHEGMELFGEGEGGEMVRVIVKEISDEGVKVDFNHPYAGLDLDFEVTVTQSVTRLRRRRSAGELRLHTLVAAADTMTTKIVMKRAAAAAVAAAAAADITTTNE